MVTNHLDNQQSWQLDGDGNYERIQPAQSEPIFNCHEFFLQSPGKIPNADDLS
jgi:polyphosphate kinase